MIPYLVAYAAAALAFLGLDFVWLGFVARSFYVAQIGTLMLERPKLAAAALFYALYVVGLVIFAVAPALRGGGWSAALLYGALFGFFAYATYEMTNYATLKGWPVAMVVVDLAWGTVLSGVAATVGYLAASYVSRGT